MSDSPNIVRMTMADLQSVVGTLYQEHRVEAHPVFGLPSLEQIAAMVTQPGGRQAFIDLLKERAEGIQKMKEDPLRYGYEPLSWKDADRLLRQYRNLLVTGPNRIGKTEWAGKWFVREMVKKPESRWWCLCESHGTSIRGGGQQEIIHKFLPPEWKALKGKRNLPRASIHYNEKNRFADDSFIAPEGQECRFMNYEQDIKVVEGSAVDGYWADELVPVEWIKTLDGRLVDRNGVGIVTFTPIYGWSQTTGLFIEGGKILETRPFPLFPDLKIWPGLQPGHIPYVIESLMGDRATIFFQLKENAYVPWESLVKRWQSSSVKEQLIRLAGITQKTTGNRFPKFGKVHVIPKSKVPKEGTNYHVIDFAWSRNWAQIWARVQRIGDRKRIVIYRDWPDQKTYGEWAVRSSKPNGDRGPAQSPLGYGFTQYKQQILQLEGHREGPSLGFPPEDIYLRLGDPRSGRAAALTEDEGGTCIIDKMAEETEEAPSMIVEPAKGVLIGEGINIINEWLNYNEDLPIDALNEPILYVSEECQQVIDCLQLWTGQGSEKEQASKDFIDLLRYLAVEDVDDEASNTPEHVRSRGGY